jgi:signal transduction histidine kinase
MMGLINDLLDVAKMEDGAPDLDLTAVSLGEVMDQVRDLTAASALERGLELEMLAPNPPLEVRADADFLGRALTNLVGNALKMTSQGQVRVWAEAGPESGNVALRVRDTGPGIPPEALPLIFEKFSQAERIAGVPRMGTGLGLTFVKMAVEAMGGRVEVESEVGHGSTFTLHLPVAPSET